MSGTDPLGQVFVGYMGGRAATGALAAFNRARALVQGKKAYKLVEILFVDHYDKAGQPYINHLLRVSQKLKNPETKVSGFYIIFFLNKPR